MHAYGVPRHSELQYPDAADAARYGMPSRIQQQKSSRKRSVRRVWKKKARSKEREQLRKYAGDF